MPSDVEHIAQAEDHLQDAVEWHQDHAPEQANEELAYAAVHALIAIAMELEWMNTHRSTEP